MSLKVKTKIKTKTKNNENKLQNNCHTKEVRKKGISIQAYTRIRCRKEKEPKSLLHLKPSTSTCGSCFMTFA